MHLLRCLLAQPNAMKYAVVTLLGVIVMASAAPGLIRSTSTSFRANKILQKEKKDAEYYSDYEYYSDDESSGLVSKLGKVGGVAVGVGGVAMAVHIFRQHQSKLPKAPKVPLKKAATPPPARAPAPAPAPEPAPEPEPVAVEELKVLAKVTAKAPAVSSNRIHDCARVLTGLWLLIGVQEEPEPDAPAAEEAAKAADPSAQAAEEEASVEKGGTEEHKKSEE